jgi:hypothetical protein
MPHLLPQGVSEIHLHPAAKRTAALVAALPRYRHEKELAALLNPALKSRTTELDIRLVSYSDLAAALTNT